LQSWWIAFTPRSNFFLRARNIRVAFAFRKMLQVAQSICSAKVVFISMLAEPTGFGVDIKNIGLAEATMRPLLSNWRES
jgi:hypothetical protein